MRQIVRPAGRFSGSVVLPGDKSISHRYAMIASLAEGIRAGERSLTLLGATGMVLGAAYMLVLLRAVLFDKFTRPGLETIKDLRLSEYAMLVPLAVMTMWLGIYPSSFTHIFDAPVAAMVQAHMAALHMTALAMR